MNPPSALEQFLEEQIRDGLLDSSGKFTLAREKALEKLAAFQLPREGAWVLKIVQSAVASDASHLKVRLSNTESTFSFDPQENWSLDDLEGAFYNPEACSDRALNHLKQALWSVSLNGLRPFHLQLAGTGESLVWDGQKIHRLSRPAPATLTLTVSHRPAIGRQRGWSLATSESAQINAELGAELNQYAYICPIPLLLDGLRLDALQRCKSHGYSRFTCPIRLGWAQADSPPLPVPPATFVTSVAHNQAMMRLGKLPVPALIHDPPVAAACLVAMHVWRRLEGSQGFWEPEPRPSLFYWVMDGVIVGQTELAGVPHTAISCAVFASAQGLQTDLTGLNLQSTPEREIRRRTVCAAVAPLVLSTRVSLAGLTQSSKSSNLTLGFTLLIGGALMTLLEPVQGLTSMAVGGVALLRSGQNYDMLQGQLQRQADILTANWSQTH